MAPADEKIDILTIEQGKQVGEAAEQLAGGRWASSCWWQEVEGKFKQDIEMSKKHAGVRFLETDGESHAWLMKWMTYSKWHALGTCPRLTSISTLNNSVKRLHGLITALIWLHRSNLQISCTFFQESPTRVPQTVVDTLDPYRQLFKAKLPLRCEMKCTRGWRDIFLLDSSAHNKNRQLSPSHCLVKWSTLGVFLSTGSRGKSDFCLLCGIHGPALKIDHSNLVQAGKMSSLTLAHVISLDAFSQYTKKLEVFSKDWESWTSKPCKSI